MTIPVPRGRKSLPTTASSTELLPELCMHNEVYIQNSRCSYQCNSSTTGIYIIAL